MNNVIENRNFDRRYYEQRAAAALPTREEAHTAARELAGEVAGEVRSLYERVLDLLCSVIAFFALPVVGAVIRAAAAGTMVVLTVKALSAIACGSASFGTVAVPLGICLLLAAVFLRVRPGNGEE